MKGKKILAIMVVCFSGLIFWPAPAKAALITIEIEAVVDSVSDEGNYLEGKIKPGDIITGSYIYDSDTPDSNPSITIGHYWHYHAPFGVSLTVGGFNFKTDSANVEFLLGVGNDGPSGNDIYWFTSHNCARLVNGTLVDSIGWQLEDPTGNALSSDALPPTVAVLANWEWNVLDFYGERGGFHVFAHVTSAIPEPTTIILLSMGGLFLRKRT